MQLFTEIGLNLEVQWLCPELHNLNQGTLVFLHEGLGSVALWRDWPEQLCRQLQNPGLVYSRQGYGRSEPIQQVRSDPFMVQGVRQGRRQADYMHHEALHVLPAVLKGLGIHNPILVGHSDGGTIALIHASQYPVGACMVMAPHVMVEEISLQAIRQSRESYARGLRERLAKFHDDVDCAFWQWNDVWLSHAFRSFDIRPLLQSITAPLLAIQGKDDAYGTLAQIDDIASHVPHTQLCKLPNCGHSPHKDQPAAVNAAIADFLSGLTGRHQG
jgi:pimeloyl-ACP methyl ester carboxylesterase